MRIFLAAHENFKLFILKLEGFLHYQIISGRGLKSLRVSNLRSQVAVGGDKAPLFCKPWWNWSV